MPLSWMQSNLINAYFMDAIRIRCMKTHFHHSATLHLWNYLFIFSASPFCIILQEKVLVSQAKLEKMCTEKLHLIMSEISFWFSVNHWIAKGQFVISTVTEMISALLQLQCVCACAV